MVILDEILKKISKMQNCTDIVNFVNSIGNINCEFQQNLLVLILRALTDRGFKSTASMLSQEYYNGEDLDGDGLIYGHDWIYANPPPILQGILNENIKDIRIFKLIR